MTNELRPTDSELDILRALWTHGPGTVKQVHKWLGDKPPRGYTTVLKLLQIMSEKGLVRRDESQRAHIYEAAVTEEETRGSLVKHLLDRAFDSSTSKLIMQALASRPATPDELAEIRRLLDKLEGESQ